MFDDLRQLAAHPGGHRLFGKAPPGLEGLAELLGAECRSGGGQPLRPLAQASRLSALDYERMVHDRGLLPVKPGWHDLFNVCAWRLFPRTKAALNRGHVEEAGDPRRRNRRRDALTLLDEAGLLILSADPDLSEVHRAHRWQDLLVARRPAWGVDIQAFVLGHGLLQQCLRPYRGLTGKALHLTVAPERLHRPRETLRQDVDRLAALRVDQALRDPAELLPLPVLGIPGWHDGNRDPDYYDDEGQFRPRRT